MTTRVQTRPSRLAMRHGAGYRHTRSSLHLVHTPTLEPMLDEEAEDEDEDSPAAPSTPSAELTPDRERELSSGSSAEDQSPSFQISDSPLTGGVGLFATRAIQKGTIIFSEVPLFTQPLPPTRTNSTVMAALSQRTRDDQRQFFTLWNAHKTPRPGQTPLLPALGIFETNALPCGVSTVAGNAEKDDKGEKATAGGNGAREGVFLQASRLNHSCRPNVCRSWDDEAERMTFRALRDIEAEEELCLSYVDVDVLCTRKQRIAGIEAAFGFKCACEACSQEDEAGYESDRRRTAVRRLYEEIGKCGKEPTLGLRKVKFALRLLNEEKLTHYEASFCFDAFQFCVLVSDFVNAKLWVRKAWEASCVTSGPDSSSSRTFKMYWANPRAHQLTGVLPNMTLSGPD